MVRTLPVISLKLFGDRPVQDLPQILLGFDLHLLVNTSRCSSQQLSVISSKYCLCLPLELRPTGTPVRLKNPDYLGVKLRLYPTTVSKMPGGLKSCHWYMLMGINACNDVVNVNG